MRSSAGGEWSQPAGGRADRVGVAQADLVTHELRNPLSVITSTAAVFDEDLEELSPEQQREYLRTLVRNAQRLAVMTDDLLDLASLESGNMAVDPLTMDLRLIIDQAVHSRKAQAAEKNISVMVRAPQHIDLYADPNRMQQVADNLLSNALKYTPRGGTVTITVDTHEADESRKDLTWTVSDTGIGIPAADRPRLFRRFYRASTALERRIPGTGLGLVITRTIIERHHGTITVADHDGPGSTFVIHLPLKPPA